DVEVTVLQGTVNGTFVRSDLISPPWYSYTLREEKGTILEVHTGDGKYFYMHCVAVSNQVSCVHNGGDQIIVPVPAYFQVTFSQGPMFVLKVLSDHEYELSRP